jgi:FMN phosphatase YigB (HAD superfamily)
MMKKLLITDLDNTLYDWVTFYASSFQAMVQELALRLGEDEVVLLSEFKELHQRYGTSEPPFAMLQLPSVQKRFPGLSRQEIMERLPEPIEAFSEARRKSLALYPGVAETLRQLQAQGITIVGHTESIAVNALHRLRKLGILGYFKHLYVLEGRIEDHPVPGRRQELEAPPGLVQPVPERDRKPNKRLLLDICDSEDLAPEDAVYIGDSLTRDIFMAKAARVTAVWARYGLQYDAAHWKILKSVSHWSPEDVAREETLRLNTQTVSPDYTLDAFSELLALMNGHRLVASR